jgi:hypothetical protein
MAPRTFGVKFPYGTQLTFGSLTFDTGEDGDLKMLPPGLAPEHPALASTTASGGSCLGVDPCAGTYIQTTEIVRGYPGCYIHPPALGRGIELIHIGIDP